MAVVDDERRESSEVCAIRVDVVAVNSSHFPFHYRPCHPTCGYLASVLYAHISTGFVSTADPVHVKFAERYHQLSSYCVLDRNRL